MLDLAQRERRAATAVDDSRRPSPRRQLLGLRGAAFAAYLLAALLLLGRTWFGSHLGQRLVGAGGDPWEFVWFMAWVPHALGHGQFPFFTDFLMAPAGANLLASTSITLPSFVLWPVTAAFGPVIGYDVLCTLALAGSAWLMYRLLCRLTASRSSAWLGGLVYGFGGYMAGQAYAHVNLLLAAYPPVVAMLLHDLGRDDGSINSSRARRAGAAVKSGLLLGLASAAQLFVDEEVLATTVMLSAGGLLVAWWLLRPDRVVVMRYLRAIGAALTVFVVLAGPALGYELLGPQSVHGLFVPPGKYVNDLAGFVVPSHVQLLSTAGSRRVTSGFSGFDGEFGSYLGVSLIALLIWAAWRLRQRALAGWLLLLCSALFSLGPHLHVWGHDTGIPLPWTVFNRLPLIQNAVPSRFNLYVWLAAGLLIALLMDDLRRRPILGRQAIGVGVCTIALVPVIPTFTASGVLRVPPVVGSTATFKALLPRARTLLIVPVANGQVAMYAQATSGFAYRVPEGAVFVPAGQGTAYGMRNGPLRDALVTLGSVRVSSRRFSCAAALARSERISEDCRSLFLSDLRRGGVDAVVVCNLGPAAAVQRYRRLFAALLGQPRETPWAAAFTSAALQRR